MAFCTDADWNITLILNKATRVAEDFTFNLNPDGTGTVNVSTGSRMSDLRWACRPFGVFGEPAARGYLSFTFRFRRMVSGSPREAGAIFSAFARRNPATGGLRIVRGHLVTYPIAADDDTPAGGPGLLQTLTADPGDTGTGNGTQGE